jgi:hypothetical protein
MKIKLNKQEKIITKVYELEEKELEILIRIYKIIYRNENYELTDEDKQMMIRPPHYNQEGDYIKGILDECVLIEDSKLSLTQLGREFVSAICVDYYIVYDNKNKEISKHLDINEAIVKANEINGCVKPVECFEEELPEEFKL